MTRWLKVFLFWLLAMALPLQGIAAVENPSCNRAHHVAGTTPASSHHHFTASCDHHSAQHGVTDTAQSEDEVRLSTSAHSASTCSSCTSCNTGIVALPAYTDWNLVPHIAAFPVASTAEKFSGHIPDRLKRPPKAFFI